MEKQIGSGTLFGSVVHQKPKELKKELVAELWAFPKDLKQVMVATWTGMETEAVHQLKHTIPEDLVLYLILKVLELFINSTKMRESKDTEVILDTTEDQIELHVSITDSEKILEEDSNYFLFIKLLICMLYLFYLINIFFNHSIYYIFLNVNALIFLTWLTNSISDYQQNRRTNQLITIIKNIYHISDIKGSYCNPNAVIVNATIE